MISIMRRSARQRIPRVRSSLETVPLPSKVLAVKLRVLQMCWIRSAKLKCISGPASTSPTCSPLSAVAAGDEHVRPSMRRPLIGGDGEGRERRGGFALEESNPFLSRWGGDAQGHVVADGDQLDVLWGVFGSRALGVSPKITTISDSKSRPQSRWGEDVLRWREEDA